MRSLNVKMIVAFLVVSLVGTGLIALYVARTTTDQFGQYVAAQFVERTEERWADYHLVRGSWEGVDRAFPVQPAPAREGRARGANAGRSEREYWRPFLLVDAAGIVRMAGQGYEVGDQMPHAQLARGHAIQVDDQTVGTLIWAPPTAATWSARPRFLTEFYSAVLIGTAGATVGALLLGVLLARSLTRPLRELTEATQAVSRGELRQRLPGLDLRGEQVGARPLEDLPLKGQGIAVLIGGRGPQNGPGVPE